MASVNILAKGEAASPFATTLARALNGAGHHAAVSDVPQYDRAVYLVDLDSIADVPALALPDTAMVFSYTAHPARATEGVLLRPFSFAALSARLPAPVKRIDHTRPAAERLVALPEGDFAFDGTPLELSKKEAMLLAHLLAQRGTLCTRTELDAMLRDTPTDKDSNLVDVYIRYIRKKLDERFAERVITAVRGKGYMIK